MTRDLAAPDGNSDESARVRTRQQAGRRRLRPPGLGLGLKPGLGRLRGRGGPGGLDGHTSSDRPSTERPGWRKLLLSAFRSCQLVPMATVRAGLTAANGNHYPAVRT